MTRHYRLAVLPGEGIGPEVVAAALAIVRHAATLHGVDIITTSALIGPPAVAATGTALPEATIRCCENADAIVLGAVTQGGLLELRQRFDLFANLRPVKPASTLLGSSPIRPDRLQQVDLLFVRELVGGIYFGEAGRGQAGDDAYGYHTMTYTDGAIRRIARVALQQASQRRNHLTVAHKENALPHLPWSRLVREEAQSFPSVTVEPMLVDNLAMQLVMRPTRFDVIVAGNLFGDILSDLGGAIAGSIGLLGSASLNAHGFGLYEPVHGTAPDIAGQGIANPLGTLASLILMLEQWGEHQIVHHLQSCQDRLLQRGYRTADLCGQPGDIQVSTQTLVNYFFTELTSTIGK